MNRLDLALLGLLGATFVATAVARRSRRGGSGAPPADPRPQGPFREPAAMLPSPPPTSASGRIATTPAAPSPPDEASAPSEPQRAASPLATALALFAYIVEAGAGALAVFLSGVMVNMPTCTIPPPGEMACPEDSSAGFTGALIPLVVMWSFVGGIGYAVVALSSKAQRIGSPRLAAGALALAILGLVGGLGVAFVIAMVLASR